MAHLTSKIALVFLTCFAAVAIPVSAAPHELRLALRDGKLHTPDLAAAVCREFHLQTWDINGGNIDLSGIRGSVIVHGLNAALGKGCRLSVDRDVLVLRVDGENFPTRLDDVRHALRVFIAEAAPQATARQARHWGLFVPQAIDDSRPLVVLIHGLDSEKECMAPIGKLLQDAGYQVGYFDFPQDQPIEETSALFADRMIGLADHFPDLKVSVIAHSMGGLIARDYIEGNAYHGGVDRLMLIGTPNAGSSWAAFGAFLEAKEQFREWKHEPDWSWTWPINSGLGEAWRDLKPGSKFLTRLNALSRRPGVRYTVIAGTQTPANRISATLVDDVAQSVPTKMQNWWGLAGCNRGLSKYADRLRHKSGKTDGPVNVASAKLDGVDDIVILAADHCTLISPDHGNPPAAWAVIRDRLAR